MIKVEFEIIKKKQAKELGIKCTNCIFDKDKTYNNLDCVTIIESPLGDCMDNEEIFIYELKEIK